MKHSKLLLGITILIFVISSTLLPAVYAETKTVDFSGTVIRNARQLTPSDVVDVVLSFSADVQKISIECASWNNAESSFEYAIYPFSTDYVSSVENEPVKSGTITYTENSYQDIEWTEDAPLPKGIYVLEITNAGLNEVLTGIRYDGEYAGQYVYENGIYTPDNSLRIQVVYHTVPEKDYGELTKPKVESAGSDTKPGALMRFTDDDALLYFSETGNKTAAKIEDGVLVIDITAGLDPNMNIQASEEASTLSAEEYPVLLLKVKRSEGTPLTGQFFFSTTNFAGPNPAGSVSFPYADTTDWQLIPVNLGNNTNYTGEILSFRYDPFTETEADCQVQIEWIAFFQSMEAAKNFDENATDPDPENPSTPTPTEAPTKKPETSETPKAASPTDSPDSAEGGLGTTGIILILVAGIVIAGIIILIIVKQRKKKA